MIQRLLSSFMGMLRLKIDVILWVSFGYFCVVFAFMHDWYVCYVTLNLSTFFELFQEGKNVPFWNTWKLGRI